MVSVGAGEPWREANRTAGPVSSCAISTQPKLLAALLAHACTSATRPAPEKVAVPHAPRTDCEALTVEEKSPPGVVQFDVLKNRAFHVALPVVAGAPPPSPLVPTAVPSPQSASSRLTCTVFELPAMGVVMPSVSVTEL